MYEKLFQISAKSPVYLQADFKEVILVHGIALQGTSLTGHYATKNYTISYTYNGQSAYYSEKQVQFILNSFFLC